MQSTKIGRKTSQAIQTKCNCSTMSTNYMNFQIGLGSSNLLSITNSQFPNNCQLRTKYDEPNCLNSKFLFWTILSLPKFQTKIMGSFNMFVRVSMNIFIIFGFVKMLQLNTIWKLPKINLFKGCEQMLAKTCCFAKPNFCGAPKGQLEPIWIFVGFIKMSWCLV